MPIVIVPNSLRDRINAKLDAAYAGVPAAAVDRDLHYKILLNYFYETGVLPDFELRKKEETNDC